MLELPHTPRLRLRELSAGDLDFVAAMLSDPEVMRFYPKVYTRDEARAWIERQQRRYAEHGHGLWLALGRVTGMPVGQVGLLEQQVGDRQESEVGYLIQRAFWRHGLATEAARATRDWAFDALGRERVVALIRPENGPSQGVARKLGMRVVEHCQHGGFAHDVWAVTRAERDAQQAAGASS